MTARAGTVPPRGTLVTDSETGKSGILMAVATIQLPYGKRRDAYIRPVGGGYEWTTPVESISPAGEAS